MSYNIFGKAFRFSTWGESHGKAIGAVIDGVPSLVSLSEADIQPFLDRRRPGQSKFTTQRQEKDKVEILSGVFEGKTTGTPISLIIHNQDQKSGDYGDIKDKFRPGHADYTYWQKYGIRDYRGGGRSSARETAMRVAVGAVALKILKQEIPNIDVSAAMVQMGKQDVASIIGGDYKWDRAEINNNPLFCPNAEIAEQWQKELMKIRKSGSSVGGVVEIRANAVPAGLGSPLYSKLDAEIAHGMMSINAVKAVEIGAGFHAASLEGKQNADEMRADEMRIDAPLDATMGESIDKSDKIHFSNNNAGGILGGISTGQEIIVRIAIKPTSSILQPVKTIDKYGNNTSIITKGRHDPCVAIRAVPVAEAMMSIILLDQLMLHRAAKTLQHIK